ncbi:PAS domain S-box protein [Ktedonobacter racemifer]|nr:PAS domain S-box protein [Ktedonobacter racemifer]
MSLSKQHPSQEKRSQSPQGREAADDRFLAVMQESTDIFCILTPTGEMQEISPSWHAFTGQTEHDGLGRGWRDTVYPADLPQMEEMVMQSITTGRAREIECHIRRYDGTYRLIRARTIPVRTIGGALREVVVCGTDITKQELAEQMSEAEVKLAVEASGVGAWDWDLVTNQIQMTDQGKVLFGLSLDDLITYERFLAFLHPDDRERVEDLIARALIEQADYCTEYRMIWPDGSMHWLAARGRGRFDIQGQPTHMIGTVRDITDQKQAEERATTVLESITDAFSYVDTQWRYTYVNRGLEKMIGKKREEVVGRYFWDLLPELLGTPFEHVYREAMATRQTRHIEGFHPSFQRWLDIHIYPTPNGISFDLHDITERKQAEEALQQSEERFRGLVESNLIGITVSDLSGTIQEANEAFLKLVGYTQEDMAAGQMQWKTITPPEYQERSAQAAEELLTTGTIQPFEKEFMTKNGKRVPVLVGRALFHRGGAPPLVIGFVLDQTAHKEIERQKDLMLSMTSHELKTPLAALKGTFQLLQRRAKRLGTKADRMSPEVSAFLNDLSERLAASARQVDVQTHLINDLLDVSRITAQTLKLELEPCDLVPIVRETVENLRVTAPERSFLFELPEHIIVKVLADRNRISQVVTNYVTNAIRYSSSEQPVTIGLTLQENTARVWVQDKGPGLTEEAQKGLWQRYHQVKGVPVQSGSGKGLGLGLYICQTLIAQHKGEVGVESTPGEGSTFWFTLPLVT